MRRMNFENETIVIDGVEIGSKYSFSDFCRSQFYKSQDCIKVIYLDEIKKIEDNQYIISLFFREKGFICYRWYDIAIDVKYKIS